MGTNNTESENFEWEDEINPTYGDLSSSELTELLHKSLGAELYDGHVFSPGDIEEFRNLTLLDETKISDKKLHRNIDIFVLLVRWKHMRLVDKRVSDRTADFHREICAPLRKALKGLDRPEFALEFIQDDFVLRPDDRNSLKTALETFLENADKHLMMLRSVSSSGKPYDSDLKYYHVHMTDVLLEYLGTEASPSRLSDDRNSWFLSVVCLLASPIFGRDTKRDGFTGLVREFIDNWNVNMTRARKTEHL